jgi:flavin-dependent dehydrogenase
MNRIYDAIIVGAGPAGTSAACFLRKKGQSILLLEKSHFPRDKVCGEFISPAAWKTFDALGVRKEIIRSEYQPVDHVVFYSPSGKDLTIEFKPEYGLGLSRAKLDFILLNHARSLGVETREGILVVAHERDQQGLWSVKGLTKNSKIPEEFKAHCLIIASGRHSASPKEEKMFGFKAHYRQVEGLGSATELYALNIGYGGLVGIEDGLTNVCFLLNLDRIPKDWIPKRPDDFMKWAFECHPMFKKRMEGAVRVGGLQTTGPLSFGLREPREFTEAIRVGDALGVIDPFLGEGITLALEAGRILADSLSEEKFSKSIRESFNKRFLLSHMIRFLSHHPVMVNRAIGFLSKRKSIAQFLFRSTHGIS